MYVLVRVDKAVLHPQWKYSWEARGICRSDLEVKDLEGIMGKNTRGVIIPRKDQRLENTQN